MGEHRYRQVYEVSLVFSKLRKILTFVTSFVQQNQKRVHRLVIDECHQLVTSSDFRPRLRAIDNIQRFALPKIYLSATLPMDLEDTFLKYAGLTRPSTLIIRAPTNRPELRYHVHQCRQPSDVIRFSLNLVHSLHRHMFQPDSRGIIFCRTVAESTSVASSLDCAVYNSHLSSDVKAGVQDSWMAGQTPGQQWISATSSFVHGIDAPYVDAVIFVGIPYGLIDFLQASARGGRRGRPCMVFLIHCGTHEKPRDPDYRQAKKMNQWTTNTVKCRRSLISLAMDGKEITCSTLPHAEKCDICAPNSPSLDLVRECSQHEHAPGTLDDSFTSVASVTPVAPVAPATPLAPVVDSTSTGADEDAYMFGEFDDESLLAIDLSMYNHDLSAANAVHHLGLRPTSDPKPTPAPAPKPTFVPAPKATSTPASKSVPARQQARGPVSKPAQSASAPPRSAQVPASRPNTRAAHTQPSQATSSPNDMGLQLNAAQYVQNYDTRMARSGQLSGYLTALQGKCPVCWAWKGVLVPKHEPFKDCRHTLDLKGYIHFATGWIDFKKGLRPKHSIRYCYGCLCPTGKLLPDVHRPHNIGGYCPFSDFIPICVWVVLHVPELWSGLCRMFELSPQMTHGDFQHWLTETDLDDHFANVIRVFMWLCEQRKL